jgi:hypothetical protein
MSSSANHRNHNGRRRNPNSTSVDRNRERAANKARREERLVNTNESRPETQTDLGFTQVAPGDNDLTNDIRNVLGSIKLVQQKLPMTSSNSKANDETSQLLGINLRRSDSKSNKPRPEKIIDNTGHTASSNQNSSYENKNTLDLLFSSFSVKHLISPISPLSSPSHVSKPTQAGFYRINIYFCHFSHINTIYMCMM